MVAETAARVSCGSPAGIHSARVGGSTQVAAAVTTVSTPLAAQATWCSGWVCQPKLRPAGIGKVATNIASVDPRHGSRGVGGGCPFGDTACHCTLLDPAADLR